MCQMSVVLENDGRHEKIMENVTNLEVTEKGIQISTLFEEPKLIEAACIANYAAGVVCEQVGIVPVNVEQLREVMA